MSVRPMEREIEKEINSLITIDLPDGELYDIVQSIDEFCQLSYDEGKEDGHKDGYEQGIEDAFDNSNKVEKINTEYCVSQFSDCKTLADFQTKLTEITNRSYNFM